MLWLYLLAVVLLGIVVAALLGRWEGAAVPAEESDLRESDVDDLLRRRADDRITAADLQEVRLDSALRGYRMDQVDSLLDALGEQLHELQQAQDRAQDQNQGRTQDRAQAGAQDPFPSPHSAASAAPEPQADRVESDVEPDLGRSDPAHGAPDKDLSLSRPDHQKRGFPEVE